MQYKQLRNILLSAVFFHAFFVTKVFAAEGEIGKIETLLKTIAGYLTIFGGGSAIVFIIIGALQYISSAGHPEALDRAKKTILYACAGLVIILFANVITNIVYEIADKSLR